MRRCWCRMVKKCGKKYQSSTRFTSNPERCVYIVWDGDICYWPVINPHFSFNHQTEIKWLPKLFFTFKVFIGLVLRLLHLFDNIFRVLPRINFKGQFSIKRSIDKRLHIIELDFNLLCSRSWLDAWPEKERQPENYRTLFACKLQNLHW